MNKQPNLNSYLGLAKVFSHSQKTLYQQTENLLTSNFKLVIIFILNEDPLQIHQ